MVVETNDPRLDSDRPLDDPNQDILGYAPFAKHLASSIATMSPTDGLVLGIYGPWGSGKTTAINFVLHYISEQPENERPLVVIFNPWWFSGQEDLTRRFFATLGAVLRQSKATDLADKISDFADVISAAPLPWWAKLLGRGAKQFSNIKGSIDNKRMAIEQALKHHDRNILIVLDDLDRLTADESRQIFRLVKAVANFPKTIYLLAFDKDIVMQALIKSQEIPGGKYLEKIIQVPFELPSPDKTDLWRLFTQHLNEVLVDVSEEYFDQVYWGNIFHDGIAPFISTPRDVVRLINVLRVTYPAVKGEVNPVDFIAIQAISVFTSGVYDVIRQNADRFVGHSRDYHANEREQAQTFYDAILEKTYEPYQAPVRNLLVRLFPKVESVWGNTHWGDDWLANWRRDLRVCSPEYFPVYFRLTVPAGTISSAEIGESLRLIEEPDSFSDFLLNLSAQKLPGGGTRLSAFLQRFVDFTEEQIPQEHIENIVDVLFKIGDIILLPEDEQRHMFDIGDNSLRIGWIIFPLLSRLPEDRRFEILRSACVNSASVSIIVDKVSFLGRQHGKGNKDPIPENQRLLTAEHVEELERIALKKIHAVRDTNNLIDTPDLPQVLWQWKDWDNEAEVKTWAAQTVATDTGLIRFLGHFLQKTFSQGMSDRVSRTRYRLDPNWLDPFVATDELIERAKVLLQLDTLSERERIALECFAKEYDQRQAGEDPNEN